MSLPSWPPAARHIITGIRKTDRDEYDKWRCGPVYHESESPLLTLEWNWCNKDNGFHGHLPNPEGAPFCAWCGREM